ncbi:MAG: type II toxin-antitoxin system HicB family antitoxin [Clostridiales bacterium]|nr:type II toxin-antitoxin system HicB family antitoxin [Clostridiales bacterium]
MKTERYFYPAIFNYEDDEIAVIFPDLNVATSGENEQDALISARELLGVVMLGLEEDKEEIPTPSQLNRVKLQKGETVTLIDVYMPSIRNANINKSVNRTVTLPTWLNSIAIEHNINFSQLLQDAIKKQLSL